MSSLVEDTVNLDICMFQIYISIYIYIYIYIYIFFVSSSEEDTIYNFN